MRRTQREQIESAILLCPDLEGASGYFAEGPKGDGTPNDIGRPMKCSGAMPNHHCY
jgi:hypothetical protein